MFEGMNYSFLPDIMAAGGASPTPPPAALTTTPIAQPQQEWYNNPGFWSMVGKFGAAIAPKDSWQRDLGLAASAEGQARQYGAGMNKMVGPMLAGQAPTQLGSVAPTPAPTTGGVNSAIPPTPGVAPGTYPGVGPVVQPVNPFNEGSTVPFSGGSSTPVLSNMEMMGLSPDQIKDVFGAAVEAKKFPIEIDRVRAGTEYTKELTRHTKAATEAAAFKAKTEQDLDAVWKTYKENVKNPEHPAKLPSNMDESMMEFIDTMDRTEASKFLSDMAKKSSTDTEKRVYHFDTERGLVVSTAKDNPADVRVEKYAEPKNTGEDKNPSGAYVNFAYSRALSNSIPALEEHFLKTLGDKAKVRVKMQQIQAALGKDPSIAVGEINSLLASAPQSVRDKITSDYNATLNSMVANKGQILPGERPQGPQSQGAEASPGILGYRKPVPGENEFMIKGLDKTEPTPFDGTLNQHFSPKDMPMAKLAMKRESSGNPRARNVNKNGTVDYGLFQINESNIPELRKAGIIQDATDLYDIDVNIKAASYLQKKYGWKPWKSSLGDLAEGKTASMKQATGWKGAGYYSVNGKKTAIRSEEEYRSITGG